MKISNFILAFLVAVVGLGTILPLFNQGFFDFHDRTQVVRVSEMSKSLESGMFPVRWVDGLGYGYGYPIFNFYGPLPYYIGGLFNLIGFDSLVSTKIMIGIGMLASGIAMFFLSNKFFGVYGGLLSASLYLYFPYHAVNLYVRGAISELFAYAFLPLIFLGLLNLLQVKKISEVIKKPNLLLLLPFGIFLTSTSHNLSILMALLMVFFAVIIGTFVATNKKTFVILASVMVLIGLILSSFYIIPAFLEMDYTNVRSQVGGAADYRDHFVCASQLWESQWGYGGSLPGCVDGLSFKLGKIHILALVISLGLLIMLNHKRKLDFTKKIVFIGLSLFIISIFMLLPLSKLVYQALPYLEYIQYPWRFLNFAGLFLSFVAGYTFYVIRKSSDLKQGLILIAAILLIILFNFHLFKPQNVNNYTTSFYSDEKYIKYTVSKISDEYMPKDFSKPDSLTEIPSERFSLIGTGFIRLLEDRVNRKTAFYNLEEDGRIHVNLAYFPSWKAFVNGKEKPIIKESDGISLNLEKGSGEVVFQFHSTWIQSLSNTISILAFLALIAVIMFSKLYGKKTS